MTRNANRLDLVLEWTGSITGIMAAVLLALNIPISGWAYVGYLMSSLLLLGWGVRTGAWGIAAQNMVFTLINLLGIYRWLIV